MNLEGIATVLQTAGHGVKGTSIFIDKMPAKVDVGILLLKPLSGVEIDHELPGYKNTTFQMIVRHSDAALGNTLALAASATLTFTNTAITGMNVKHVRPRNEPIVFPVSEGDKLEFSVNFNIAYVDA